MGNKLRICIVAFLFAPIIGGAEIRAEKYGRQLQKFGHEVTIVTLRHKKAWKKKEVLDGLPIIRVGGLYMHSGTLRIGRLGHLPIDILMFLRLWRLRHHYDVIYAAQVSPLTAVAALIGKLLHKPVIVSIPSTGLGQEPRDATLMADTLTSTSFLKLPMTDITIGDIAHLHDTAFGGRAMIHFLKKSDAFYQVLSSRSYPYLTSQGFKAEKIVRISGGVDTEKFHPAPALRPDPTKPERDIVCVARLEYPKGIDVLLHAWSRMMREPAPWHAHLKPRLLIAGIGSIEPQLQRMTAELGIQESVKFLGLCRNVIPLLQRAWAFILPSRWEGMPNALLEAMACQLPCIATRVSGSEDIIIDAFNGLLIESEQPAEMAQALCRLIEDIDLAQRIGKEGHATVVRDYELSHIVEQCVELYRSVLSKDSKELPFALKGREE